VTLNPYFQRAEAKREKLIQFIRDYIAKESYPPTLREMGAAIETSIGGIQFHLNKLRQDKLLTWEYNKPRTLRLLK